MTEEFRAYDSTLYDFIDRVLLGNHTPMDIYPELVNEALAE